MRGVLKPEAAADVVVFNPNTIRDRADYNQPYQVADGVRAVTVNGELSFIEGGLGKLNGQVIRRS